MSFIQSLFRQHFHVIKNTGYLSIIEVIRLIMPLVALPYIISVVGTYYYGLIAFAQVVIYYFTIFICFGLDTSVVKEVAMHRNDKKLLSEIISSVILIRCILALISMIVFVLLIVSIPFMKTNAVLFIFSFLMCFSEILFPVWFFQGIEKMKYIALIRFSSVLVYVVGIFLVIKSKDDYLYIPLLQAFGMVFSGGIAFYIMMFVEKNKFIIPNKAVIKKYFLESVPFFIARISGEFNVSMAKMMSGIFLGMNDVAIVEIAQKISSFAQVPIGMLNQALYPNIAKTKDRKFVNKLLPIMIGIILFICLFVLIFAPFLICFFSDSNMMEAVPILRILTIYIFFAGIVAFTGSPVLVAFGFSKPSNNAVIYSTLVLVISYVILYFVNYFNIFSFIIVLVLSEVYMAMYRMYYCYKYDIFSYKRFYCF